MIRRSPPLGGERQRNPTPCADRSTRSGPSGLSTFFKLRWIRSPLASAIKPRRSGASRGRRGAFHQGQVPVVTKSTTPLRPEQRLMLWRIRTFYHANPQAPKRSIFSWVIAFFVNAAGLAIVTAPPLAIALVVSIALPPQELDREPECRHQWTSDVRYVQHCNHHDGLGFVEVNRG